MEVIPTPRDSARSEFVTRLSWALVVITGVLALFSISTQVLDFRSFDPTTAPGVRSAADAEIMGNLNWALLVIMLMLWVFLLYASWSLGRRRDWARKAILVVFAFLVFALGWNTILSVLFILGAMEPSFLQPGFSKPAAYFVFTTAALVFGLGSLLCWWIVRRLRSKEVLLEFRHET